VPPDFARLVSLACHDLRTPLATVQGFAKTLIRVDVEPDKSARYLGMIDEASEELAGLTDRLSLAARIEGGRYEPVLREVDSLELVRAAEPSATGEGGAVSVDADAVERAIGDLARAAARHGGAPPAVVVDGAVVRLRPVPADAAAVVLGDDQKDLGAAVAVLLVRALGGDVAYEDETVSVHLPTGGDSPPAG
jgi:signal transduction histidine kinase